MLRQPLTSLVCGGLLLASAALIDSRAAAENLACPSDPQTSFIVQSSCLTSAGAPAGIQAKPCLPSAPGVPLAADARTVEVSICSKALKRVVGVRVLLPKNIYSEPLSRSPTLYLLHGANTSSSLISEGDYRDWTNNTTVEQTSYRTNAFVVTPEGGSIGWYSDWRSTPTAIINWSPKPFAQNWETHFFNEVIPLIDAQFANNGQRVIAGLSMGGMGAVSFAARGPQFHGISFRAAASFSGDLETQKNYVIPEGSLAIKGLNSYALWGDPTSHVAGAQNWSEHDPIQNVTKLVDLPLWIGAGNGQNPSNATDIDAVEVGAWYTSTDFANAQIAANNRENALRASQGNPTQVKGYVVRDMGSINNLSAGCAGQHKWPAWDLELKRAWAFLDAHLTAAPGVVPPASGLQPVPCGQPITP